MPKKDEARIQYSTDGSTWIELEPSGSGGDSTHKFVHFRDIGKYAQKLKFYYSKDNFKDFDGEDYIRMQIYEYDPDTDSYSWTTRFMGKARSAGDLKERGEVVAVAEGIGTELQHKKIDLSADNNNELTSTNNFAVVEETVSGETFNGVEFGVVDSGATKTSIDRYSTNEMRKKTWREMEDYYDWSLYFEPDKKDTDGDSSDEWEVRYEPRGYYDSGETIDTSDENVQITDWEEGIVKKGAVVNAVKVVGVDDEGNKYSSPVVEDKSEISKEYFRRYNVGYVKSDAECEDIANNLLRPNKSTNGKLKLYWHKTNLINETINVKDSTRDLDGTTPLLVKKQVNYYPERRSVLYIGDIDDEGDKLAREGTELREERAKILTSATEEVGNQNVSTGSDNADVSTSGGVDDNASDTSISGDVSDNASDTSVSGGVNDNESDTSVSGSVGNASFTNWDWNVVGPTAVTFNDSDWTYVDSITGPDSSSFGGMSQIILRVGYDEIPNTSGDLQVVVTDSYDNYIQGWYASFDPYVWNPTNTLGNKSCVVERNLTTNDLRNTTLDIYARWSGTSDKVDFEIEVHIAQEHSHGDNFGTNDNQHPHGDNLDTNDNQHPHGDDFSTYDSLHPHGDNIDASDAGHSEHNGSTDSKSIDKLNESKEDR